MPWLLLQIGSAPPSRFRRPFAQTADVTSAAYTFSSSTGKIDMREQRRELRLKFVSNVAGGDYQVGKILLDADVGDSRPYG